MTVKFKNVNVGRDSLTIQLENGVDVHLSSNDGYVHLSFSGVHVPMSVGAAQMSDRPAEANVANLLNIYYKSAWEE